MKKTIIALSIISVISYATQYNALVTKEHSKFKSTDKYETIEATEWLNTNNIHSCYNFSPLNSEIYKGTIFTQLQECQQEQERTVSVYLVSSLDGSKELQNTYVEFQNIETTQTVQETGTYLANSCLDIKNHSGDIGDGHYVINFNNQEQTVLCDMTRDNGGWTLLVSTGSDVGRPHITSLNINKNNPPASADYSVYNYYPVIDYFIPMLTTETNLRFSCVDNTNQVEHNYYHKNINNFGSYLNLDSGIYTGSSTCASSSDYSENYSTTNCLGGNNTAHRYYRAGLGEYGWAHYNGNEFPKMLRHCGAGWYGNDTPSHNGYIWFK